MAHTLFFTPGACSLSPHIALPYELAKVDLRTRQTAGASWRSAARSAITTPFAAEGIAS